MQRLDYALTPDLLFEYLKICNTRIFSTPHELRWWQGKIIGGAISGLMTATAIVLASILFPQPSGKALQIMMLIMGIFTGLLIWQAEVWYTQFVLKHRLYREGGPNLAPQSLTVDQDQLKFASADVETILCWPAVTELTEHKNILVLWIEPSTGFVLPRSAFAGETTAQAFCAFARDRIAAFKPVSPNV